MDNNFLCDQPELWAGPECSVIRVNDVYRDQLAETGHFGRPGDIELISGMKASKVRYPILWEHHQPSLSAEIDWSFTGTQLEKFNSKGIEVIAGLLHHGSGPSFTSLDDPDFPAHFSRYAAQVAQQFPHLKYYTPINEPLTTARFSGLYGFWFPHQKSELIFFRILLNQLKAVVLAMQAIRRFNPNAELIQTEDLANIRSTTKLHYQAEFENKRKWLTLDFLCGKIIPEHFFWDYLIRIGIAQSDLEFFLINTCPPQLIGHNYYVTSERFLDEHTENYSPAFHGGNGVDEYVDIELVRAGEIDGLHKLLTESWNRYHIPIALTECHLNCTREEQLRWIRYCFDVGRQLRFEGVRFQAITIWSIFGSMDWNSLVTQRNSIYETGVLDIRGHKPRTTALAKLISLQSTITRFDHPLLSVRGWWENPSYSNVSFPQINPVIILGEEGNFSKRMTQICVNRNIPYYFLSTDILNTKPDDVIKSLLERNPWAIIYAVSLPGASQKSSCKSGTIKLLQSAAEAKMGQLSFSNDIIHWDDNPLSLPAVADATTHLYWEAGITRSLHLNEAAKKKIITFGTCIQFSHPESGTADSSPFPTFNSIPVTDLHQQSIINAALDIFIDIESEDWEIPFDIKQNLEEKNRMERYSQKQNSIDASAPGHIKLLKPFNESHVHEI